LSYFPRAHRTPTIPRTAERRVIMTEVNDLQMLAVEEKDNDKSF